MDKCTEGRDLVQSNVDRSRRRLTQLAWTTPVVASIALPVHAQTSDTTTPAATPTPPPGGEVPTGLTCMSFAGTAVAGTISPALPNIDIRIECQFMGTVLLNTILQTNANGTVIIVPPPPPPNSGGQLVSCEFSVPSNPAITPCSAFGS